MFYTIEQVKAGLLEGKSYVRIFGSPIFQGREYLRPIGNGMLEHTVAGAGYGGVNEMPISHIATYRWPQHGWEDWEKK